MPGKRKQHVTGFARNNDRDLDGIVRTICIYCGAQFVGSASAVLQFEEQHRELCEKPVASTAANESASEV